MKRKLKVSMNYLLKRLKKADVKVIIKMEIDANDTLRVVLKDIESDYYG